MICQVNNAFQALPERRSFEVRIILCAVGVANEAALGNLAWLALHRLPWCLYFTKDKRVSYSIIHKTKHLPPAVARLFFERVPCNFLAPYSFK